MDYLTINEMIKSIENEIITMENEAFYETNENDFKTQLNIYKHYMVKISAKLLTLKNINNGYKIIKKG